MPMSLPKSHGGALTVHPYANKTMAASMNNEARCHVKFLCSPALIRASPPASSRAARNRAAIAVVRVIGDPLFQEPCLRCFRSHITCTLVLVLHGYSCSTKDFFPPRRSSLASSQIQSLQSVVTVAEGCPLNEQARRTVPGFCMTLFTHLLI